MPTLTQIRLNDPLNDVTRKERRNLLGVSALGVLMAKTGLVPSSIFALGIEFSSTDQKTILRVVALVVLYFLCAFVIYAVADFLAWGSAIKVAVNETAEKVASETEEGRQKRKAIDDAVKNALQFYFGRCVDRPFSFVTPIQWVRVIFEFLVPIILGLYSIYSVIRCH